MSFYFLCALVLKIVRRLRDTNICFLMLIITMERDGNISLGLCLCTTSYNHVTYPLAFLCLVIVFELY